MNNSKIELHRKNLEFLIKNSNRPADDFMVENGNVLLKPNKPDPYAIYSILEESCTVDEYLDNLMREIRANSNSKEWEVLFILGQKAKHLLSKKTPNFVLGPKHSIENQNNSLHEHYLANSDEFVKIIYNENTRQYRSPDDDKFGEHGKEAKNIFLSTQSENIKEKLHYFFKFLGIHVFESAAYQEHNYIPTDIYSNDLAIAPFSEKPQHFWAGHAENFLQLPTPNGSIHVLTDPVEGNLNALFYPRKTDVANRVKGRGEKMLPHVDVIVISHNHRDHVDIDTLKCLVSQQPLMIIPKGDRALFEGLGFSNIRETVWWDQVPILDKEGEKVLTITAVPTRHWSNRGLCDAHRSSFNGYVIRNEQAAHKDIYFAGDTALMEEKTSAPIYQYFDIGLSIQPGGPDEMRDDMKSTHQSSADALLMHFKKLKAIYDKKENKENWDKENFLDATQNIRTVFNHTATFKLGNLHLRDTFYSMNRVIAAFTEGHPWAYKNLEPYEIDVYMKILDTVNEMNFLNGSYIYNTEISEILQNSVVMPKIGERQGLDTPYQAVPFSYRNLIVQKRGLEEFDKITKKALNAIPLTAFDQLKELTRDLFDAYQKPWHSRLTRSHRKLTSTFLNSIKDCHSADDLLNAIQNLTNSRAFNRYGHMHALVNYTKWIIHSYKDTNDLSQVDDYLKCKEKREIIHKEAERSGFGRTEKQKLFKELGHELAKSKTVTHAAYNTIIQDWNDKNRDVLHKHRFFNIGKTKSEQSIEAAISLPFSK